MIEPQNYEELEWYERKELREAYVDEQKGRCYYCHKPLLGAAQRTLTVNRRLFPQGFFDYPVHLHHDHKTGMTVGAVHAYCNAILWQYHGE